jgi:hypothetical protein
MSSFPVPPVPPIMSSFILVYHRQITAIINSETHSLVPLFAFIKFQIFRPSTEMQEVIHKELILEGGIK